MARPGADLVDRKEPHLGLGDEQPQDSRRHGLRRALLELLRPYLQLLGWPQAGNPPFELRMPSGSRQALEVLDAAGESNAFLQYDFFHMQIMEGDLASNVENLLLSGNAAINGTGNALVNAIYGNGAANVINGGGGADLMSGGDGDDTYFVDNAGDMVDEGGGSGIDRICTELASFDLTTAAILGSIENLAGTNATGQILTGNTLDNVIDGGGGADTMSGGAGADDYWVDNGGDVVIETLNDGTAIDTVHSTVSWTLGAFVENLVLLGPMAINGVGNGLSNNITGTAAANTLNGGAGADVLQGLAGNDSYVVDDSSDQVIELSGGGNDTVLSSASNYTLSANVENGNIMAAGTANLTGNSLANMLLAGNGNNVINGDTGNDTVSYIRAATAVTVDLAVTIAQATGGSGIDTLTSIENLTGSDFNDTLAGNSGANRISGGGGNDRLNGGLGNDLLIGGAGRDLFVFNSALGAANIDRIQGYNAANDTILLENNGIFAVLATAGVLAAEAFNTGSAATQADDRIIYNAATGALLYDTDGTGAAAAVQFATLSGVIGTLSFADFVII